MHNVARDLVIGTEVVSLTLVRIGTFILLRVLILGFTE